MPEMAPSLHFPRGNAYLGTGDFRRAADEYGLAIEAGEGGADAYANRGVARTSLGDPAGAAADFREALRRDPTLADARTRLKGLTGSDR